MYDDKAGPIKGFQPVNPSSSVIGGYKTRLIGLAGSPFPRVLGLLDVHPLARTMRPDGGRGWYLGGMAEPFAGYFQELELRDRDPKTRLCYAPIVSAYQRWLQGGELLGYA